MSTEANETGKPRSRRRKISVERVIREARQAGERGPVTIEIVEEGRTVRITSQQEGAIGDTVMPANDTNPWAVRRDH